MGADTSSFDVVIAGGGPAGLAAAIAAGRRGARVLLIERHGFVGGMSTAALVNPWMTFHDRTGERVVHGIAQEIVEALMERGASPGHLRDTVGFVHSLTPFDPDHLRILADEMLAQAGCSVLYHGRVIGADRTGDRITGLTVMTPGGERVFGAKVFVDTTGDAAVCHAAGLAMQTDVTGQDVQPMSLCFRLGGVDWTPIERYIEQNPSEFHDATLVGHRPVTGVSGFFTIWAEADLPIPRDRLLFFAGTRPGQVYMNTSRIQGRDGTDPEDLSAAEVEGRRQARILVDFVRSKVPGFADCHLDALPTQVGVRETRRVLGEYTLSAEDAMEGRRFADAVARSAYPIDIHSPTGKGMVFSGPPKEPYDVPFRCLVPQGMANLLVAGRCISATHEGHASTRLTPTCMAMGEAAGTAAAQAAMAGAPVMECGPGGVVG
jgi:hypothetical protein